MVVRIQKRIVVRRVVRCCPAYELRIGCRREDEEHGQPGIELRIGLDGIITGGRGENQDANDRHSKEAPHSANAERPKKLLLRGRFFSLPYLRRSGLVGMKWEGRIQNDSSSFVQGRNSSVIFAVGKKPNMLTRCPVERSK